MRAPNPNTLLLAILIFCDSTLDKIAAAEKVFLVVVVQRQPDQPAASKGVD